MAQGPITVAWSEFRLEALPLAERLMTQHALVILEEPPTPGFAAMLDGEMDVDAYLELTDFEFPAYQKAACQAFQRIHGQGVDFAQVHPWMEELITIHEFFLAGNTPQDLQPNSPAWEVYCLERQWTKALIDFYQAAGGRDWEGLLAALIQFAQVDAAKFRAMDLWRAQAVAALAADHHGAMYVEAGALHWTLWQELRQRLGRRVRACHILGPTSRQRWGRRLLAPGDRLTLGFLGNPMDPARQRLLAARALVYNRLLVKEEMFPCPEAPFPHLDHEAAILERIESWDEEQCRQVFFQVRRLSPAQAWTLLARQGQ